MDDLHGRTAAIGRFREEVRRLANGFQARHVRWGILRLLSAFRAEVDQHSDRLHVDGPLERLLAWLPPPDRPAVVSWIRARGEPPRPQSPGRPSRAYLQPVSTAAWGLSPFVSGVQLGRQTRNSLTDSVRFMDFDL